MTTLRKFLEKSNIDADIAYDEPMSRHTSLRIGGPADALVCPRTTMALAGLIQAAHGRAFPVTVIGGGANLLVADAGIRGIVLCTSSIRFMDEPLAIHDGLRLVRAGAGVQVNELVAYALERGLSGLEFAAGLPGSIGGAVYMNARCYEREMADALVTVDYVMPNANMGQIDDQEHCSTGYPEAGTASSGTDQDNVQSYDMIRDDWAYKQTPFMPTGYLSGAIIMAGSFVLLPGDRPAIAARMADHQADRRAKGHFDWPSAGSLFKNDRRFGRPTGMILDELGFRGRRIGDAMVSPKHANIFVNAGSASARDMLALIHEAQQAARQHFGIELEPEVVLLGDFTG
jgi:UDP-N-acetylmuramate dehydrogenase